MLILTPSIDVQSFYADYVPEASNSTFDVVLVNGTFTITTDSHSAHPDFSCIGGENPQNISEAGQEADLDVEYAFGLTYPTPGTFWSVGGSPPFDPDTINQVNQNEPYVDVRWIVLSVC